MTLRSRLILPLGVAALAASVSALNNGGVARTPVMGYNAWNVFQCNIDEDLFMTTAELMVSLGLKDAGYEYINLDDCYASKNRTENGTIVEDPAKFPSGMRNLTDRIHAMGFKTGIYSDSGWFTCAGYPGSFEHEEQDANTFFNDWNFDLLKFDNCAIPFDDIIRQGMIGKYQRMADEIAKISRPIVFSLCEWGWSQVWLWGAKLGQSWRTTGDISPNWDSLANIINANSFITQATNFYGRNDMDMLQLGNGGLTYDEAKSHFTAWALMKSPLLIGTNLSAITDDVLGILTNSEIIAINQDDVVGESLSPFRWVFSSGDYWASVNSSFPAQYWSGDSQNGTVFMLLNTLDETADMSFNLTESPWIRAGRQYAVRDLWTHTDNGTAVRDFTAHDVPPHGVVALLMTDAGDEPDGLFPQCEVWFQCTDQNGTRVGG